MMISVENRQFFPPTVCLTPPLYGFRLELGIGASCQKAPLMGLSDGGKSFMIGLVI